MRKYSSQELGERNVINSFCSPYCLALLSWFFSLHIAHQKTELEPIVKVWLNHDNDLVDLTITSKQATQHDKHATTKNEVVHTTKKHPFLTIEHGFLPVAQLKVGMHIQQADGHVGVITTWLAVPGAKTMYNLEVANDHTFVVGQGQWVVHNCSFETFFAKNKGIFKGKDEGLAAYKTVVRAKNKITMFENDNTVFKNLDHLLPGNKAYREWTVNFGEAQVGTKNRGLLRVISGGNDNFWFTRNHYGDFSKLWWP